MSTRYRRSADHRKGRARSGTSESAEAMLAGVVSTYTQARCRVTRREPVRVQDQQDPRRGDVPTRGRHLATRCSIAVLRAASANNFDGVRDSRGIGDRY